MTRRFAAVGVSLVALLAACGGSDGDGDKATAKTTTTVGATTAVTAAAGVAPLTGLPGGARPRPALVVKIDNAPKAHPQAGLNQADIVVEEGVEGGITRFATIFHSNDSDPVGPVRSARSSDIAIVAPLRQPLFSYSGTNRDFEALLDKAPLVNVGPGHFGSAYFRQPGRPAPYNYFSRTSVLYTRAPAGHPGPQPQFIYRAAGQSVGGGQGTAGVHIEFRGRVVTAIDWSWDAAGGVWTRRNNGANHVDAAGQQVTAANVVVEFVDYKDTGHRDQSGAVVPEAELIGEGEAWVFTQGQVVKGRWQKPAADAVTRLLGADGQQIELTPGRTWVELPVPGLAQLR